MISAHYGLSEVFDNLIISLCKFTTFLNSSEVRAAEYSRQQVVLVVADLAACFIPGVTTPQIYWSN